MIHWLIQSLDDCPEIMRSDLTPVWLSAMEQRRLSTFKVEKRRRDWLLGRWTAKNLVQRYMGATTGETPTLETITVAADADGAPYVRGEDRRAGGGTAARLPVSLSISHSHGTAFCGLVESSSAQRRRDAEAQEIRLSPSTPRPSLGCDIEIIEPREPSFIRSFFTATELAAVEEAGARRNSVKAAPGMEGVPLGTGADTSVDLEPPLTADGNFERRVFEPEDVLITAIWSAKEAVLKALRTGLRIDTRRVNCRLTARDVLSGEWTPFVVTLDADLAERHTGKWLGWCGIYDQFVLTLALHE